MLRERSAPEIVLVGGGSQLSQVLDAQSGLHSIGSGEEQINGLTGLCG